MPTKIPGSGLAPGAITADKIAAGAITAEKVAAGVSLGSAAPTIATVTITDSSYTDLDDTAVDVAGGYIKITGTELQSGCVVMIGLVSATSVTFVSSTEIHVQVPAQTAGTYPIYVINPDGVTAARLIGLTYSGIPTWVTNSALPDILDGVAYSQTLVANGAVSYSLAAGSSLPTGLTLDSNTGILSGSVSVVNVTSYSFTILATDTENQDSPRTFSVTATNIPPFTGLTVYGTTSGATTGTFIPSQSSITVYGCGGGGNGGRYGTVTWDTGNGGGGGGASQLYGYVLSTTAGETLSYSVGGPAQPTTISRGGTVIFQLNAGSSGSVDSASGAAGGAANEYASHAGGSGASGGGRKTPGQSAGSAVGCAGGGGGGGYGDNSPLVTGSAGGNGGTSTIVGTMFVAGGSGASGGGGGNAGGNKLLAIGGQRATADIWVGGGAGAGAGIRLASSGSTNLYGGGGGGNGASASSTANTGGPGLLHITAS